MNLVFTAGKTGFPLKRRATSWTPQPQAMDMMASTPSIIGTSSSTYSGSHCLSRVCSRISMVHAALEQGHVQTGSQKPDLFAAAGGADRHAFVAADQENALIGSDIFDKFFQGFSFSSDHCGSLSSQIITVTTQTSLSCRPRRHGSDWAPAFESSLLSPLQSGQNGSPCRPTS